MKTQNCRCIYLNQTSSLFQSCMCVIVFFIFVAHIDTVIYISRLITACVRDTNETPPTVFLSLPVFNTCQRCVQRTRFIPAVWTAGSILQLQFKGCGKMHALWKSQGFDSVTYNLSWFSIILGLCFPVQCRNEIIMTLYSICKTWVSDSAFIACTNYGLLNVVFFI